MSERKLRTQAETILDYLRADQRMEPHLAAQMQGNIGLALAEEPDVVKWAKREARFLELAGGDPEDVVNPFDPLSELGKAWWRGYRQCSADTLAEMQEDFDFCLTEAGWEWTEEQPE